MGPFPSIATKIHSLPYNMVDASHASVLCTKAHEGCAALSKLAHSQYRLLCKCLAHHELERFDAVTVVEV